MRPSFLCLRLLVALVFLLQSCGDVRHVYTSYERDAVDKFESVRPGVLESEVREKLGDPRCIVTLDRPDQETMTVWCPARGGPRTVPRTQWKDWPPELGTLSPNMPTRRVLVYVNGTVFAHYFLDEEGKVTSVEVNVS